jgi:hypothetical protein
MGSLSPRGTERVSAVPSGGVEMKLTVKGLDRPGRDCSVIPPGRLAPKRRQPVSGLVDQCPRQDQVAALVTSAGAAVSSSAPFRPGLHTARSHISGNRG